MAAELPTTGLIYGVRLRSEFESRYVGLTTKSIGVRLKQRSSVLVSRCPESGPLCLLCMQRLEASLLAQQVWAHGGVGMVRAHCKAHPHRRG
ncbi:hypothetical protein BST28_17150 [Mycolicibacter kumamotonensis]|uniref:Uncharacterized protein n=1 Tax=Mycolicibacter kumamotonensis TaxID=354243 RepID=A0A1X0DZI9_9MYCO|nr:hypothetical protein BST28_17150 [Mycolicibacter kumamotonensis]